MNVFVFVSMAGVPAAFLCFEMIQTFANKTKKLARMCFSPWGFRKSVYIEWALSWSLHCCLSAGLWKMRKIFFVVLSGTFKLFWKHSIKMNNPVYKKNKAFQAIKLLSRQKESAAKHVLPDKRMNKGRWQGPIEQTNFYVLFPISCGLPVNIPQLRIQAICPYSVYIMPQRYRYLQKLDESLPLQSWYLALKLVQRPNADANRFRWSRDKRYQSFRSKSNYC